MNKFWNKGLWWLTPYFLIAFFFMILPMIFLFFRAVIPAQEGFDNWFLLKELTLWKIMGRSILAGLLTALFCFMIGFPYAYIVSRSDSKKFKTFSVTLILAPLFIFTIVRVVSLRGLLTAIFTEESLSNVPTLVLGLVYLNLPFMIVPLYSVLSNMPKTLTEASEDLGYNQFQTIYKVVFPYCLKAILSGITLVFLLSATSIIVSKKLIPKADSESLIGNIVDDPRVRSSQTDAAVAATISIVTLIVMMAIYAFIYFTPLVIRKLKGGVNV